MTHQFTRLLIVSFLFCLSAYGQSAPSYAAPAPAEAPAKPQPPSLRDRMAQPRRYTMGPLKLAEAGPQRPGPAPVGLRRRIPEEGRQSGGWSYRPNGRQVWRLEIQEPEAVA